MLCEHSIVDIPLSCVHLTTASSQWIRFTESAAYLCWTWWIDLSWRFNRLKWFRLAAQLWERENVFDSKRFKSIIDFNVRNSDLTNLLNAFHSEKLMIREESSLSWFLSTLIGSWSIHGILYAFEVISSTFQCVSSRLKRLQVIAILQDLCMLQFSILSFSSVLVCTFGPTTCGYYPGTPIRSDRWFLCLTGDSPLVNQDDQTIVIFGEMHTMHCIGYSRYTM